MTNRQILQPRSRLSYGAAPSSSRQNSNTYATQSPPQTRAQAPAFRNRTMEEQQRINNATMMREENELLVWRSMDRNESIPQTKLHYDRDMLFIDSDDGGEERYEDDESGDSVEWQEDYAMDSDDQERMQPGVRFGPDGWYNPQIHDSVQERLQAKAEQRRLAAVATGKARVKSEDMESPQQTTPKGSRRKSAGLGSSGGTPGRRKASGGKRAFGTGGSGQA